MPLRNWNIEFLNANSERKYPLTDSATGIDDSASFTLPDDFIVNLDFPVSSSVDIFSGNFFIRRIGVFTTGYSIVVGYQTGGGPIDAASAFIPRSSHTRNKAYALGGVAPFDDSLGSIVIGSLTNIDRQAAGEFTFDLEAGRLEPSTIRPNLRGVGALTLLNGSQRSPAIYGDVELAAGANVRLTVFFPIDGDPTIRIDAVTGEGLIEECVCTGDVAVAPPIRRINGVGPAPDGNLNILGSDCLEVAPVTNGLKLTDVCSRPCCSCVELEKITQDLERLKSEAAAVEAFASSMRTSVQTMDMLILGSSLRDRGCTA